VTTPVVTGRRIGAAFIDLFVYWALCFAIFFAMADSGPPQSSYGNPEFHIDLGDTTYWVEDSTASLYWFLTLLLAFVYFGVLQGLTGRAIGKALTGIRIVRPDGSHPGLGRGLLRSLLWIVDGFPYFLPGLVGFILILANKSHRRVADMVADTDVVKAGFLPQPTATPAPMGMAGPPPGWYADPHGQAQLRWWDGRAWSEHTHAGQPQGPT
jgi:uncharacterized RDD family membrane protein YckC